jgi:large subunit ribosomal protein L35Ae
MKDEYVGVIMNYRRGPKSQRNNECLLKVLDVDSKECMRLIGWKIGWPLDEPRMYGYISKSHGRTGNLSVKFKKGLPGQALGTKVKISKK